MTLFLFWWTNKHTHVYTRGNRLPLSGCVTAQFAQPNPRGTGKDGINHNRHLTYTGNQRDSPPERNYYWSSCFKMEVMFAVLSNFLEEFASHSQHRHTDTVPMIPLSRPNVQAGVRHSISGLWNHISAWNMTFPVVAYFKVSIVDQFLSVEFWHVNNSERAPVTLWICCHDGYRSMVHWLCIWKSQVRKILKSLLIYWVCYKAAINFNVMMKFSKHSLKISPQSTGFHIDFGIGGGGGVFTNLKQCKQTTGPKSVVPGAEMHRTGGGGGGGGGGAKIDRTML